MDFRLRLLLWIPALTYEGVVLSGGKDLASLGQITTLGFLGAILGFLLASMLTIRQCRREKLRLRH
jgi:pilus assembly protein TadC